MTRPHLNHQGCKTKIIKIKQVEVWTSITYFLTNPKKQKGDTKMQDYPWWKDSQRKLMEEAEKFTDEILIPSAEKSILKKEYPWEAIRAIGEKDGWGPPFRKSTADTRKSGVTGGLHPLWTDGPGRSCFWWLIGIYYWRYHADPPWRQRGAEASAAAPAGQWWAAWFHHYDRPLCRVWHCSIETTGVLEGDHS